MRIAAIDIGSNAARLLVVEVAVDALGVPEFNKLDFTRLPLRLGFDVFENGVICEKKTQKIVTAMQVFHNLLNFYDVTAVKACATSAMRDAKNGQEIIETVARQVGLNIQIISGDEEALLVHNNHIAENMDREHGYLYINVGGGSTELIFFVNGELRYKKSVNIGTIRILKKLVNESHWNDLKADLKAHVKSDLPLVAIGSGGNINKVFSLSKKKEGKPLSWNLLKMYYEGFKSISVEERIHLYRLREDRADVIVPALEIYLNVMRWADIKKIYVPKIGLVDGLAHALYQEVVNTAKDF